MKTDKNFRMKQSTKRMLTNLEGEERTFYKNIMIDAQLIAARPPIRDKKVNNDEPESE
jgi:hypothetical protein